MTRSWKQALGDAYEVSIQLVKKAEEMYSCSIIQDEEGDPVLDIEQAINSPEYRTFLNSICELEKVRIGNLSDTKLVAFFLNVYQCMYIHNFIKTVNDGR